MAKMRNACQSAVELSRSPRHPPRWPDWEGVHQPAQSIRGIFITIIALVLPFASSTGAQQTEPFAIVNANVVDVIAGQVMDDAVIIVDGARITSVGAASRVRVPPDAHVIDAGDRWVLPGLMNMHVHFGLVLPGAAGAALANETEAELALRIAVAARESVRAGITTVRLTGERGHVGLAVKRAIDRGEFPGPRIFSAGVQVQVTGGHGSAAETVANDGVAEFREAVRKEIRAGASWIKIAISGGIATPGGDIAASFMTNDELDAVTDIAHRHGVKVTAHSGSPVATRDAVHAGIDCIEHGYFLTATEFELMKEHGTWYVPTIVVSQPGTLPFFERIGSPQWYLDRVAEVGTRHWSALQAAIRTGVRIALGTDQLPHEPNDGTISTVREAEYYVEAGMTTVQALRSATIEPAAMLGMQDQLGSIDAGKFADLIVVPTDPTESISALRTIQFVMRGGQIIRNELAN